MKYITTILDISIRNLQCTFISDISNMKYIIHVFSVIDILHIKNISYIIDVIDISIRNLQYMLLKTKSSTQKRFFSDIFNMNFIIIFCISYILHIRYIGIYFIFNISMIYFMFGISVILRIYIISNNSMI